MKSLRFLHLILCYGQFGHKHSNVTATGKPVSELIDITQSNIHGAQTIQTDGEV